MKLLPYELIDSISKYSDVYDILKGMMLTNKYYSRKCCVRKIFFRSKGENCFELSLRLWITNAAVPDTIGADMLVPPNIPNGSCL